MASWPPAYTAAFIGTGYTTIRWGTDGIMTTNSVFNSVTPNTSGVLPGNGTYGGFYIVESIRGQDEIENIYIEQGTGLKATAIQLWQGRNYTLTVVDDTDLWTRFLVAHRPIISASRPTVITPPARLRASAKSRLNTSR